MRYSNENHVNRSHLNFQPLVNSKDRVDFAMLFTLWASLSATTQQVGKAGGLQILRCQGFAVDGLRLHPWRLSSEALRLLQR